MLAKLARTIPDGDGWLFEPKWDGFRCIVFRDGDDIELASRNERPFTRYFPELLEPLRACAPGTLRRRRRDRRRRPRGAGPRLRRPAPAHPPGRVARPPPGGRDAGVVHRLRPPRPRRRRAAGAAARRAPRGAAAGDPPDAADPPDAGQHRAGETAAEWFGRFEGAGLDGIVAKRLDDPYLPDKRALVKVKHERTADCVVAGYRIHKDGNGVGSLLLGLYDDEDQLQHVGVAASFSVKFRAELLAELEPLTHDAMVDHPWRDWAEWQHSDAARKPGATSRWNAGKDLSWVPIRVERVAEVTFGQLEKRRFRHGVSFVRWRPDREPESCRYDQLDVADPVAVRRARRAADAPDRRRRSAAAAVGRPLDVTRGDGAVVAVVDAGASVDAGDVVAGVIGAACSASSRCSTSAGCRRRCARRSCAPAPATLPVSVVALTCSVQAPATCSGR